MYEDKYCTAFFMADIIQGWDSGAAGCCSQTPQHQPDDFLRVNKLYAVITYCLTKWIWFFDDMGRGQFLNLGAPMRKTINTGPTTLSAILYKHQAYLLLSMNNYTPLVNNRNDKNK
jgi:hypothetical protein